jgi:hypothetical protein
MWKSRQLPRRQFRRNILDARNRINVRPLAAKKLCQRSL